MNNDSPQKALVVVLLVALVCSVLVSVASVVLRPVQLRNQLVERSRNIVALTGLVRSDSKLTDDEILATVAQLDIRVLNIDTGEFDETIDPATFDERAAVNNPELNTEIPAADDLASLSRRSRYAVVYLVWDGDELTRVILPINGQGMWSTLYGFIALEADMNTIGAVSFYEQAETAGLGDQITQPAWLAQWQGREVFDSGGNVRFRVAGGAVDEGSAAARHEVDALTGASVTAGAVSQLVAYWFGPHGYATFLNNLQSRPPARAVADAG